MDNLELYNKVKVVPETAKKKIGAGRLKGMTDINPMWRIKTLTENFGWCGFGWKTVIKRTWLDSGANGEITANVEVELFVKQGEDWSDGIIGIGGSKLVSKESGGMYTDDECYKKAYTDAISVACKALGVGADVYFEKDSTKYDELQPEPQQSAKTKKEPNIYKCSICGKEIADTLYFGSKKKYGVALCSKECKTEYDILEKQGEKASE